MEAFHSIWFNFLLSRACTAFVVIHGAHMHTHTHTWIRPVDTMMLSLLENWKEKRCAVSTAMTSCCDLMYISVFVLLYCFSHTHTRTTTTHTGRHSQAAAGCPFLSWMWYQHRLCYACAMGSQAYDLLDATMNIDAIDWKSAGEIKCQHPPNINHLPSSPFPFHFAYFVVLCVCAVMSTSWGRKQFKLQSKLNKNVERKNFCHEGRADLSFALALDMHKIWHYRKFPTPHPLSDRQEAKVLLAL